MMLSRSIVERGSQCELVFLLDVLLVFAVVMGTGFWAGRAHRAFLRLYRSRYRPDLVIPSDEPARVDQEGFHWFVRLPGRLTELERIARAEQADPEVEQARRRSNRRWQLVIAATLLAVVAFALIYSSSGC